MDAELRHRFLAYLKAMGIGSWKYYKNAASVFLRWLSSKNLSLPEVTPTLINQYLCFRKSSKLEPATHFYPIRTFFRYAVQAGIVHQDPTTGVFCSWLDVPGGYPAYQGVLRQLLRRPAAILKYRLPLFTPDLEMYVKHLLDQGYSKRNLCGVLHYNFYFHRYLARRGIERLMQITPDHVEAYQRRRLRHPGKHDPRCSDKTIRNTQGYIEGFLRYAFDRRGRHFRPPPPTPNPSVLPNRLVEDYLDFCRIHKGLKASTREDQQEELRRLGLFLTSRGLREIQKVALLDLDAYCLERSGRPNAQQKSVSVLRSFLRYLYLEGILPHDWAKHIHSPCRFHADTRPKYLPWNKIQDLLAAVDRSDVAGKRNYAILALLACHGLRAREAAGLKIADIEWADNSFLLRERKNGATTRLPLSPQARQALQEYIAVRPVCPAPEVFLTAYAPIKPLGKSLFAVAHRLTYKHLGRLLPHQGAYVLRHSFAKVMLDRGASLSEIGTLLGHTSLHSTFTYTRIATEDMREVADNYAGLLSPEGQP
ncbi:MAG TPA: hypothetical protein DCZ01_05345 [Elusimicrobia bacterium]|nr:hypothetical protein [Elusimicrobiota bacterium]